MNAPAPRPSTRLLLRGRVQGVGLRPFIVNQARSLGLAGWVRNRRGGVELLLQGDASAISTLRQALTDEPPPAARIEAIDETVLLSRTVDGFTALPSDEADGEPGVVPPDLALCDACRGELEDPADRRGGYPFINCTQCGPRYTLIEALPYDRAATGMKGFPLCDACAAEYADPVDRRYRAEPLACAACGPAVTWQTAHGQPDQQGEAAIDACLAALGDGSIVALRGVGGYHLLCDATNANSVATLRTGKGRPRKPLALLVPRQGEDGLDALRRVARISATEADALRDPAHPIVLVKRRDEAALPPTIAPGLDEIGVMLPYSPLHQRIAAGFGKPLVATSANRGGEPLVTDPADAQAQLAGIVDGWLHHDRPILRPAEDSVVRAITGAPRVLRLGRGYAPLEMELPFELACPTLALGAQDKVTLALGWGRRAVISPHIGDSGTARGRALLRRLVREFPALFSVQPRRLVRDAHPGYGTSRLALALGGERNIPVAAVWHHHAHASAAVQDGATPVFTWDGVGLGADGDLWGGELLRGGPGRWLRAASFRRFALAGGERAAREPWRSAAALCWSAGIEWRGAPDPAARLRPAWSANLNCHHSSAAGRLFDAAAALVLGIHTVSHEAEGPMALEAAAGDAAGEAVPLPLAPDETGLPRSDWGPLVAHLLDGSRSPPQKAADFHATLARCALDQLAAGTNRQNTNRVALGGGVFQNRLLTETICAGMQTAGIKVALPDTLPLNDGAISFGQIVEAAARDEFGDPAGTETGTR